MRKTARTSTCCYRLNETFCLDFIWCAPMCPLGCPTLFRSLFYMFFRWLSYVFVTTSSFLIFLAHFLLFCWLLWWSWWWFWWDCFCTGSMRGLSLLSPVRKPLPGPPKPLPRVIYAFDHNSAPWRPTGTRRGGNESARATAASSTLQGVEILGKV